jgi:hypothetical protein
MLIRTLIFYLQFSKERGMFEKLYKKYIKYIEPIIRGFNGKVEE